MNVFHSTHIHAANWLLFSQFAVESPVSVQENIFAMTQFDPEKFDEKYVYYLEELETAYRNAYNQLHGRVDSTLLKAVDRQVFNESEPFYEGEGKFRLALPENPYERAGVSPDNEAFERVLTEYTERVENELAAVFEFPEEN